MKIAKDIASGTIKVERKQSLMDTIIANALRIKYIRDMLLGKAKESVIRATGGYYPAPLKVYSLVLSI